MPTASTDSDQLNRTALVCPHIANPAMVCQAAQLQFERFSTMKGCPEVIFGRAFLLGPKLEGIGAVSDVAMITDAGCPELSRHWSSNQLDVQKYAVGLVAEWFGRHYGYRPIMTAYVIAPDGSMKRTVRLAGVSESEPMWVRY
jgi:hypothetical protein